MFSCCFSGNHSDRLALDWRNRRKSVVCSQTDASISERPTLRCCERSWLRLLLECTWTIPGKQGQMQTTNIYTHITPFISAALSKKTDTQELCGGTININNQTIIFFFKVGILPCALISFKMYGMYALHLFKLYFEWLDKLAMKI